MPELGIYENQTIQIGENILVTIERSGDEVRVAIEVPEGIPIVRTTSTAAPAPRST